MVKLEYDGTTLLLDTHDRPDLQIGMHRLYLSSVAGLRYDDKDQTFRVSNPKDTPKLIERIVSYLAKNSVQYELGSLAESEYSTLQRDRDVLGKAREEGLRVKSVQYAEVEVPGLVRKLMDYQKQSVVHLVEVPFAANFSVPGSGKTTIALAAYAVLKHRGIVDKILIIGPRSCFVPWEEEYAGCFGSEPNSLRIVGDPDHRRYLLRTVTDAELYLATYQMAVNESRELANLLRSGNFLLVLDESHYVKRLEGGIWADNVLELGRYAKRRLILTGTPAPNALVDLWSQFTFLWPSRALLGERASFKIRSEDPDAAQAVKETLRPFFCRIRKSDLGLPSPKFEVIKVELAPKQRTIYNALAAKVLADVSKSPEERAELRAWKKAQIIRLLQTASNPTLLSLFSDEFRLPPLDSRGLSITDLVHKYPEYEVPSKFETTEKLARNSVEEGEKVIIWTWFIHNIQMLRKRLEDQDPLFIYGEVPKDDEENEFVNREKFLRIFKSDPKPRILIANPSATAESISLHKVCHRAIYMDRTFNCGQYLQSLDRIHRVGLQSTDLIRYQIVVAGDTVDEVVNERLNRKIERMSNLLDDELPVLDLEQPTDEVTGEEGELDDDFDAVLEHIEAHQKGPE